NGQGDEAVAGRDDIGLDDVIEQRRSLGAEAGHGVIAGVVRRMGAGGSHGDDVWIVGRSGDRGVAGGGHGVVAAEIARGHHYHDTGLPGLLHGLTDGIERVRFRDPASQREIDDANVVAVLELDGALNRRYYRAVSSGAVGVKNPEVDQVD